MATNYYHILKCKTGWDVSYILRRRREYYIKKIMWGHILNKIKKGKGRKEKKRGSQWRVRQQTTWVWCAGGWAPHENPGVTPIPSPHQDGSTVSTSWPHFISLLPQLCCCYTHLPPAIKWTRADRPPNPTQPLIIHLLLLLLASSCSRA